MKELSLPVLPGFHHINPGLNVMWLSSLFSPKATKLLIITLILKTNHENPINYHLQVQITCSTLHVQLRSVQSLSRVWLFETTWTAARQASLSITNSQSLLKLTSIASVMPSNHLILCCPLLLLPPIPLSIRVLPMNQLFTWGGQSTGVSASASVLPMHIQGWFLLGLTG